MARCVGPGASHKPLYSGTVARSLCRVLRGVSATAVLLSALVGSGCSYQLASLGSRDDPDSQPTGSLGAGDRQAQPGEGAVGPAALDLSYARAAASKVLAGGSRDVSVPWENPESGAGGNITPLASAYTEAGQPCRDFVASYVHGGSQEWLQGAGCRSAAGAWEVKRLKPLRPS